MILEVKKFIKIVKKYRIIFNQNLTRLKLLIL